jgi:hypothetical protein
MSDEINKNDFPEKHQIRQEAVAILLHGLKQQQVGKPLSKTLWNLWGKVRNIATPEFVQTVENNPEAAETAPVLDAFLKEQMEKTRFFLSVMTMVDTFKKKG